LNGIGSVAKQFPSLVFIQQALPYSREALRRCPPAMQLRMAVIRWITRRSAKAADHILVQSKAMRQTISREFAIPSQKISAFVPGTVTLPPFRANSPKLQSMRTHFENGSLLYVGDDAPHKNLSVVEQGLAGIPSQKRPKWYVTLDESSALCRRGLAIPLGKLSRSELCEAYQNATIVVMPSLIETVGLPLLESMQIGTPVLVADRPYAHSVCEDAAIFFDPLSPKDFSEKAIQLLSNTEMRADLVGKGRLIVAKKSEVNPYHEMIDKVIDVASCFLAADCRTKADVGGGNPC